MKLSTALLVTSICACAGERWQWPEHAASVRIDTKVRFIDEEPQNEHKSSHSEPAQADEAQFVEPTNTEGFYNRPPGAGRYPVRVQAHPAPYRVDRNSIYSIRKAGNYYSDGTLDSLQYCKCFSTPECNPSGDSTKACGPGRFLCCYKRPNKRPQQNTEFFNEVEDERPVLLPNRGEHAGPFPPPPDSSLNGAFDPDPIHQQPIFNKKPILVGPDGPTGLIGPAPKPAFVGPDGPTGIIGQSPNRAVLVGPEGPTGAIGPQPNRGVLAGPGGPTGVIGPVNQDPSFIERQDSSESAQRGVLVGPGGPTGIIGPAGYGRRPVLVGPGGPTGIIGPYGRQGQYGRQVPAVLVGPGGPTGMIGPPRRRPYYYGK